MTQLKLTTQTKNLSHAKCVLEWYWEPLVFARAYVQEDVESLRLVPPLIYQFTYLKMSLTIFMKGYIEHYVKSLSMSQKKEAIEYEKNKVKTLINDPTFRPHPITPHPST